MSTAVQSDNIKMALPKGRLLPATARLFKETELEFDDYAPGTRNYRLKSTKLVNLSGKIFQEKDVPVQVAVGNYDIGICGLDWGEELLTKYPSSALVKLKNLRYGEGALYVVASRSKQMPTAEEMREWKSVIRLASEYPNLAESFALNLRFRRFSVFPLWEPPRFTRRIVLI